MSYNNYNNCDWVWESPSYLHANFDHIFSVWSLITFSLNMMLIFNFYHSCINHWRVCWNLQNCYSLPRKRGTGTYYKAYSVFCVDKAGFLRLSHNCNYMLKGINELEFRFKGEKNNKWYRWYSYLWINCSIFLLFVGKGCQLVAGCIHSLDWITGL